MPDENNQGYFYTIPAILAENGNSTKALLYGLITSLCRKEGYCYASNKYLAKKLGKKDGSIISRYISELEIDGWIAIQIYKDKDKMTRRRVWLKQLVTMRGVLEDDTYDIPLGEEETLVTKVGKNEIPPLRKKPKGSSEKTEGGLRKKPKGSLEKTEHSNINKYNKLVLENSSPDNNKFDKTEKSVQKNSGGIPEKIIRSSAPAEFDKISKSGVVKLSSVDKEKLKVKKKKLSDEQRQVYLAYREKIYSVPIQNVEVQCLDKISKAEKMFREVFKDKWMEYLLRAIEIYSKDDYYLNKTREVAGYNSFTPVRFFSDAFITDLISRVYNQNNHGSLPKSETEEERCRRVEKVNEKAQQQFDELRQRRETREQAEGGDNREVREV